MSQNKSSKYSFSFESPVRHLLHTNVAPTTQECAQITGYILVQSQRELAQLDDEMERLHVHFNDERFQKRLTQLNTKRAALAADIDAHSALLSPIRRVPDDVLREIFVASLPETNNAVISSRESPLLLCGVTSGWRQVALSTPWLWSSLHLVIPDEPYIKNRSFLIERWLTRSGILPLSLSVGSSPQTYHNFVSGFSRPLFDLLFTVSNRWQAIELMIPRKSLENNYAPFILSPTDVPRLTHVKFNARHGGALYLPFLAAPSISSLSLSYMPGVAEMTSATISWPLLTRLELFSGPRLSRGNPLRILERCINLESCTLALAYVDPDPISYKVLTLSHLHSLSVTCWDSTVAAFLLKHICAPKLKSLECFEPVGLSTFPFSNLLIKATKLRNIAVTGLFTRSAFLDWFTNHKPYLSSVETFQIHSQDNAWQGNDDFSDDDSILDAVAAALPALTALKVHGCSKFTATGLLAFCTARVNSGTPLQRLDIRFNRPSPEDILPSLADFISHGLVVSLKYEEPDEGKKSLIPPTGA
ncbi:hypothetical protein B0H19DRAFT_1026608 [Mycena capillaripes]|nr:hypothetical protein B0H19DRAFT_1026608 [Mycena capillaripes]